MTPASFPQTRVSEHFHRHVKALEGACVALGEADSTEQVDAAYRDITLAREALYQYAESLEKKDRLIERTIVLRF